MSVSELQIRDQFLPFQQTVSYRDCANTFENTSIES